MFELGTDGPLVILVGIDGSETSMRAGAYAAGLARRQGAKLVLAYFRPVGSGNPQAGAAIAQLGLENAADLERQIRDAVVIGASEQAGHRILGSVAVRLVKAGRWPVTVVP